MANPVCPRCKNYVEPEQESIEIEADVVHRGCLREGEAVELLLHSQRCLRERDEFLVTHGYWDEFVRQLP
jgi:hypothetical protein